MSIEWALAKHYSNPQGITKHKCSSGNPYKNHIRPNDRTKHRGPLATTVRKSSSASEKNCLVSAPFHRPGFMLPGGERREIKYFLPQGKNHLDAAAFERELLT